MTANTTDLMIRLSFAAGVFALTLVVIAAAIDRYSTNQSSDPPISAERPDLPEYNLRPTTSSAAKSD